jgi:hypothetical protein
MLINFMTLIYCIPGILYLTCARGQKIETTSSEMFCCRSCLLLAVYFLSLTVVSHLQQQAGRVHAAAAKI